MIIRALLALLLFSGSLLAQEDGSERFTALRDAVKPALPNGYALNEGQTHDNRFSYQIAYDRGDDESDRLIFRITPGADSFSEMDDIMAPEKITFAGHEGRFADGAETGMSSIHILLGNGAGKFTVTHRALGGTARDKAGLIQLLEQIDLAALETRP